MIDMDNLWKISKDDTTHSAWAAWAALPELLRRIEELEAAQARPEPRRSQEGAA